MRLTYCLMAVLLMLLVSGCANKTTAPVYKGPLFCDLYEVRIFSQEEIDWRAANAPWNLRRDLKDNAAWKEECTTPH